MTNCKKVCGLVSLHVGVLLTIAGSLVLTLLGSSTITNTVINGEVLSTDTTSSDYTSWADTQPDAVPSYTSYYFMTITNPTTFLSSGTAQIQQVGPYTFQTASHNFNVTFANNQVTYYSYTNYTFIPSLSSGALSDSLTIFNYVYLIGVTSLGAGNEVSFLAGVFAEAEGAAIAAGSQDPFGTLDGALFSLTTQLLIPSIISSTTFAAAFNGIAATTAQMAVWGNAISGSPGNILIPLASSTTLTGNQAAVLFNVIQGNNATLLQGLFLQDPNTALATANVILATYSQPAIALTDILNIRTWALQWASLAMFPSYISGYPASTLTQINETLYNFEFCKGSLTTLASTTWVSIVNQAYAVAPSAALALLRGLLVGGLKPTLATVASTAEKSTYTSADMSAVLTLLRGINTPSYSLQNNLGALQISTSGHVVATTMVSYMANLALNLVFPIAYSTIGQASQPFLMTKTVAQLTSGFTDPILGVVPALNSPNVGGPTTQNLGGLSDLDNIFSMYAQSGKHQITYNGSSWNVEGHSSPNFRPYGPLPDMFISPAIPGGRVLSGPPTYKVWVGSAQVPVTLYNKGPATVADLSVNRYEFDWDPVACVTYSCPAVGILPIFNTSVVYLTQPQFLNLDPNANLHIDRIQGLNPNSNDHGTYLNVETITGVAIDGHQRLQTTVVLPTGFYGLSASGLIANQAIPVFWIDLTSTITDSKASSLKASLYGGIALFFGLGVTVILIAGILVIMGVALLLSPSKRGFAVVGSEPEGHQMQETKEMKSP